VHLTWAFSEAAVLFLGDNPPGQKDYRRMEHTYGPGKALTVLAQKRARAVYDLFKRHTTVNMDTVRQGSGSGVGEPTEVAGSHRNDRRAGGEPGFREP
jgi:hypothetical protein